MKISYSLLKTYFKKLPPPERLAELINLHITEVERIIKFSSPLGGVSSDILLDLKVLSNRPEYLSYWGLVKEIGIILGEKPKLPETKPPKENGSDVKKRFSLKVGGRYAPTYLGKLISKIKVEASPAWLRSTLEASGLLPVNNIVDLTNLVMLQTGQPLHVFDADQLRGGIAVRLSHQGEKLTLLDKRKIDLPAGILLIADQKGPLALAGIRGGLSSGVSHATTSILLEAATFDPRTIRLGSKKVGIQTDASLRFERGLSPTLPETALGRFLTLLPKVVPKAVIHKGLLDFRKKLPAPKKISFTLDELNGLIGAPVPASAVKKILSLLDFKVSLRGKKVVVISPLSRFDVKEFPDLAEEVLRFWGLPKIKPRFALRLNAAPVENPRVKWGRAAREVLRAGGFDEVYTRAIVNPQLYQEFKAGNLPLLELENPLSAERSVLRRKLWPNLLEVVRRNRDEEEIKIFELGALFKPQGSNRLPDQPWCLCGLLAGRDPEELLRQAKGAVQAVLKKLGINFEWRKSAKQGFIVYLDLYGGREKLGAVGLVNRESAYKVEKEAGAIFQLNFDKLVELATAEFRLRPLPKFPPVKFDIAVVVEEKIKAQEIYELVSRSAGRLLEKLELFDIFHGKPLPAGRKSLAYHITLRSGEGTLTDEDREKVEESIKKSLQKVGGVIRE